MLTKQQVQDEIEYLINSNVNKKQDDKDRKKAVRRVEQLTPLLQYLRTDPTEEYVRAELNKNTDLLIKIDGDFKIWKESTPENAAMAMDKARAAYQALKGVSDIRRHIKAAQTILSGKI